MYRIYAVSQTRRIKGCFRKNGMYEKVDRHRFLRKVSITENGVIGLAPFVCGRTGCIHAWPPGHGRRAPRPCRPPPAF